MEQNFLPYNQSTHSQYANPNYCNYNYYNYYQENIPDQFVFTNQIEDTNYQSLGNNSYSNYNTTKNDKTEFTKDYNYGMTLSFNDSQNYSYNDSAYQTQLETSSLYFGNNYYVNETLPTPAYQDAKKRPRDNKENESTFFSIEPQLESNKRPKILKLKIDETKVDYYYCEQCGLSFSSKAKYLLHQFKAHKNGSSCVCPVCYKKFGNQANTLVHLRGHTQEKTYKCNQCSHAFYDSSTLKKHLRTHSGEKPYSCHLCTKKFTQSGNLKRHLLVHKKYDEDIQEGLSCTSKDNKEYNQFDWSKYPKDQTIQQQSDNYNQYCNYNNFISIYNNF
ncbi:Transcription factor che-1 [Brachionus plicatilis]|uniref:Transcription factor che-1 n=1 Tax=Brachionus plicatilis TaxID=10195 RepID=A0A3M7Q846_BRAPC|nr:Transcription factor che-1 [Brachionus plicatilis]